MDIDEYKKMANGITAVPFGIPIAQTWLQLGSLFQDLEKFHICFFVELGVYMGGLADLMLVRQSCIPNFHYYGVQLLADELDERILPHIKIGDVLNSEIIQEVKSMIASNKTTMVYCDAGNKNEEMRVYAPLLKPGDYLRSHDYPGETTPDALEKFRVDFPYMQELDVEKSHSLGYALWRRVE
jgi:cephalosporin hydroxylase